MTRPAVRTALALAATLSLAAPSPARSAAPAPPFNLSLGPAPSFNLSPGPARSFAAALGPAPSFNLSPGPARSFAAALGSALSFNLSFEPAASERDLAYELGIQAEVAGDHGRAAAAFERAYRLTAPAETGPRLLFLRASVAARLRAAESSPLPRLPLCQAQALLRHYLEQHGPPPAPGAPDPIAEERASAGQVEQRLAGSDGPPCDALLAPALAPAPAPTTAPTTSAPPPSPEPAPTPAPARPHRPLRISGGVGLGVGVVGLAVLVAGVVLGRKANARGHAVCREAMTGCAAYGSELRDIEVMGRRGDTLVAVGVVAGALGLVSGAVLLAVGERLRRSSRRRPIAWTPRLGPGSVGLDLSARF